MKFINFFFRACFVSVFLFSGTVNAQKTVKNPKCGFDIAFQKQVEKDPTYLERYMKLQNYVRDFAAKHPDGYEPKAVITIPVVFHVVLSASQDASFADVQVYETITMLNRDYSGSNTHSLQTFSGTPSLKANTTIQFCLASVDTNGQVTTGIERRNDYSGPQWSAGDAGMKHVASGGLNAWDVNNYLNIWICDLDTGLCGYGILPVAPLNNEYGLVDDYQYTGHTNALPPLDGGGTAAHEIGHCFNLEHPWGNGNCDSDNCNDTPPQNQATYGNHMPYDIFTNPGGNLTNTGNGATPPVVTDNCTPNAPGIMYTNFMDYSDDTTYANFTPDQKTIMLACFAPGGPLYQLTQSGACGTPPVADFSGNPLTIQVNNSVTFSDSSDNSPSMWVWTFEGGSPSSYLGQNPPPVTYDSVGFFTVTLVVSNSAGTDSMIRSDYIHVLPVNDNPPVADFYATQTTLPVGGSTDFVDLSDETPTSWRWTFEGGTPSSSALQNPTGIVYNTAGIYSVSLTVINWVSSDTLLKEDYIEVDSAYTNAPGVAFTASQRLIPEGTTVYFTDTSSNSPTAWNWTFPGGSPSSSNIQNPAITYNNDGEYNVTLQVSNPLGFDSLTKTIYIKVYPGDSLTYFDEWCSEINNQLGNEILSYRKLPGQAGYVPGPNNYKIKAYADKYVNYTYNIIKSVIVPFHLVRGSYFTFKVWGAKTQSDGAVVPDDQYVLGSKIEDFSQSQSPYARNIIFSPPVHVYGTYFIGYEINITGSDSLVVHMFNRTDPSKNTLYVKKNVTQNPWDPIDSVFTDIHASLAFRLEVCLADDIDYIREDGLLIYPNPSHDIFNIEIQDNNRNNVEIRVFDMLGKYAGPNTEIVSPHLYQVDMGDQPAGIYFISIRNGNNVTVKKISVVK